MASASVLYSEEHLSCPICLDVFTRPVTTPCGDTFCKACITKCCDGQVQYKCPLCKEVFHTRPDLRVNCLISEMADLFRRSVRLNQHSFPDQPCVCDICTGTQLKAVKTCLVCLTSYCDTHLEPHQRDADLKRHPLIDPVDCLGERSVEDGDVGRQTPGLRKYACELTLDPNTAHRLLSLSEDNRKVTLVKEEQSYPDYPERFTYRRQVLCREGLTGRCYWEVERKGGVDIGVTYRGITRRGDGDDSRLGGNNQSWSLYCYSDDDGYRYSAWYNNISTDIRLPRSSVSTRVGVYVDCSAGTLSFYSVSPHGGGSSGTLTHIHTFQTTFTQTLYPGVGLLYYGSSVSLCQL